MTTTLKRVACRRLFAFAISLATLALILSGPSAAQESNAPASDPAAQTGPASPEPQAVSPPANPVPVAVPAEKSAETAVQPAASAPTETQAPAAAASRGPDAAAVPVPAAPPAPLVGIDASELPRNLSPWGMFMQADIVVKGVMIGLAFASVITWTVWLAKTLELALAKRKLRAGYRAINAAPTLAAALQRLGGRRSIVGAYIEQAALELQLSNDVSDRAGISERVASRVMGLSTAAGRAMNRGTGVLATIASTAPFVGLFGTVWGIMNSFIGISESQTTNLAVVAPGIAEALLATAIGLVAAIPAVIIYNQFSRSIGAYKAALNEAADEVMRIVSRDLDRGVRAVVAQAAE